MTDVKPRAQPPADETFETIVRSLPARVARWTAAAVGFVATLLGLVFVLFPALKPDEPAVKQGAMLSNATVEQLSFGQYLDREDLDRAPYDASALGRRGIFVEFDFVIDGFKNKQLPLRWQLVDISDGEQLGKSRDTLIEPEAATDQGSVPVWVPLPRRRVRRAYVQLQLYEKADELPIGRLRTPPFRVVYPPRGR